MEASKSVLGRAKLALTRIRLTAGQVEHVAFVRPDEAPTIVKLLREHEISYHVLEGRSHGTWEPMVTISVAKSDAVNAVKLISEARSS